MVWLQSVGVLDQYGIPGASKTPRARPRLDRRDVAKVRGGQRADDEHAGFACSLVCMRCGRLRDPDAADPFRGAPGGGSPGGGSPGMQPHPCYGCGHDEWADLSSDDVARALAQVETHDREDTRPGRRAMQIVLGIGAALVLGLAAVMALLGAKTYAVLFSLLTALFAMLFVPALMMKALGELRRRRRKLPYRWMLALPPATTPTGSPATGDARARGECLRAPVSGVPCIGYELVVRRGEDDGDAVPALVEQRCVDFFVGERAVAGARALLRLADTTGAGTPEGADDATRRHLLRARGFLPEDGPWSVIERVLLPGTRVTVAAVDDRGTVVTAEA